MSSISILHVVSYNVAASETKKTKEECLHFIKNQKLMKPIENQESYSLVKYHYCSCHNDTTGSMVSILISCYNDTIMVSILVSL